MEKLIKMYVGMQSKLREERGATMVEYGLMVALIAVIAAVGAGVLGENVNTIFTNVAGTILPGGGAPPAP